MQTLRTLPTRAALTLAAATAGMALLLAGAGPARAAPFVDVTYDLGESSATSTIPALGVTTEIPPHGTISGTQTIRYTGTSGTASGLATGPVELLTFNLYVHATVGGYSYTPGGGTTFSTLNTSDLHFEFLNLTTAASVGQRLAGGTVDPLGASGVFRVTGFIHCYKLCGQLDLYATTTATLKPDTFVAPLPVLTGASGASHTVRGTATGIYFAVRHVDVGLGAGIAIDVTGTNAIVGREVQRTPVPEPNTLPLMAAGLIGLGLAGAAWRGHWRG